MVTTGVLGLQGVGLIAATDKVNVNLEQQLKVYIEHMKNCKSILALKLHCIQPDIVDDKNTHRLRMGTALGLSATLPSR